MKECRIDGVKAGYGKVWGELWVLEESMLRSSVHILLVFLKWNEQMYVHGIRAMVWLFVHREISISPRACQSVGSVIFLARESQFVAGIVISQPANKLCDIMRIRSTSTAISCLRIAFPSQVLSCLRWAI